MVEIVGKKTLKYTGTIPPQPNETDENGQRVYPYLPYPDLVDAVNIAIELGRPLLLKGEPGCGKTQLARAVARELGLPFKAWYIKSTSRAKDGLYTYDTVARLRDAQLAASRSFSTENLAEFDNPYKYRKFGPLGSSFQSAQRTVVLIDEIDKADIDFPNDLLLELDERRFFVEETGEEIWAKPDVAPIVFITSNDEKDLPDAFLRRCLFHYVEFPDEERLKAIIYAIFQASSPDPDLIDQPALPPDPDLIDQQAPPVNPDLVDKAVKRFMELRKAITEGRGEVGKNVSTSELIDWFKVLQRHPQDQMLTALDGKLPFLGVLLKSRTDSQRYLAYLKQRGGWHE